MTDLISREAALDAAPRCGFCDWYEAIRDLPAAQVKVKALVDENERLTKERDRFEAALARACLVGGTTYLVERAEAAEAKVAKLVWERERLALAICGGEGFSWYANAQPVEVLEKAARDNNKTLIEQINQTLSAEARAEALREAAAICEKERSEWDWGYDTTPEGFEMCHTLAKLRDDILALIDKEKE